MDWESQSESAVGQLQTHHTPVPPPVQPTLTGGDGNTSPQVTSAEDRSTPPEGTSAGDGDTSPTAGVGDGNILPEGIGFDTQPQPPVWGEWVLRVEVHVQVHVHVQMSSGPQGQ